MSLGFVMIGMVLGFVAAVTVWMAGAGVFMALLAYSGCGALGMVSAVILATRQTADDQHAKGQALAS